MRERACDGCSATLPVREGFLLRGKFVCAGCAEKLKTKAPKGSLVRARDPTLCSACGLDNGDVELPTIADVPLCDPCTYAARHRPFPVWLKASAGVLLLLLVAALIRGMPVVASGLAFIRAERHAKAQRWSESSDQLALVLAAIPDCAKATLLKVKADLLCDRFDTIEELVDRLEGEPFEGKLIDEVNGLLDRFDRAAAEFAKGAELAKKEELGDAEQHLEKARSIFPESRMLRVTHLRARAAVQFDAKDYDGLLASAEAMAGELPADPISVASVASACAAKYATTGDVSFKNRSRELLEKATGLCTDEASRAEFEEYRERIEHRLRTREIIDKDEYDRRFRQTAGDEE